MNHLADPAAIVLSPASTATYRRYHHDPDPAIGGTTRLPNLPATSADRLVRAHFQTNPTLRSIQATPTGHSPSSRETATSPSNRAPTSTPSSSPASKPKTSCSSPKSGAARTSPCWRSAGQSSKQG